MKGNSLSPKEAEKCYVFPSSSGQDGQCICSACLHGEADPQGLEVSGYFRH